MTRRFRAVFDTVSYSPHTPPIQKPFKFHYIFVIFFGLFIAGNAL